MSLGVALKGPEGVVLAADSRVTLGITAGGQSLPIHYDNATKLLALPSSKHHHHVGAVTYGAAVLGLRTVHSYLPELELQLPQHRLKVEDFAQRLSDFFMERWRASMPAKYDGPSLTLLVGGYDEGAAYGRVFLIELPSSPKPVARNPGEQDFGMTWGGQIEIVSRLIHGWDPALPAFLEQELGQTPEAVAAMLAKLRPSLEFKLPFAVLPLQDCIDLATFLIRTTIAAQRLAAGVRGVGGQIEVAVITRTEGLRFIQRKRLRGEAGALANAEAEDRT